MSNDAVCVHLDTVHVTKYPELLFADSVENSSAPCTQVFAFHK